MIWFDLTSWIMSMSSASVGFCPKERMTVPSSLVVMVPGKIEKRRCHCEIINDSRLWHFQGGSRRSVEKNPFSFPQRNSRSLPITLACAWTKDLFPSSHGWPWTGIDLWRRRNRIAAAFPPIQFPSLHAPLTIAVLIEKAEGFLEFGNLFFGQLIGHGGNTDEFTSKRAKCDAVCWLVKSQIKAQRGREWPNDERWISQRSLPRLLAWL